LLGASILVLAVVAWWYVDNGSFGPKGIETASAELDHPVRRPPTSSRDAFALYLQARHYAGLADDESLRKAQAYLEKALTLDAEYVDAWIELGRIYRLQGLYNLPLADAKRMAAEATLNALAIDPGHPATHAWLGWQAANDGEYRRAAKDYSIATSLNSRNVEVLKDLAGVLLRLGRLQEAFVVTQYVVDHDPLCAYCIANLARVYQNLGRIDEAVTRYRAATALAPENLAFRADLGIALLLAGDPQAALDQFEQLPPDQHYTFSLRALALHSLGREEEFESVFADLRRRWPSNRIAVAGIYAWMGDADGAFAWLQRALQEGSEPDREIYGMPFPPVWRELAGDSRWSAYLMETGQSPEQLAAIAFEITLPR
jgi:tetratricopeptide (TPR) repeat protein